MGTKKDIPQQELSKSKEQKEWNFLGNAEQSLSNNDLERYYNNTEKYNHPIVVSLDKDKKRWKNAKEILISLNYEPIRFSAILGSNISGEPFFRDNFSILRNGETGCLASHLCVMALAANHGREDQYTLIFEDDIVTSLTENSVKKHLDRAWNYNQADLVYLGKCLESCSKMTPLEGNMYWAVAPSCLHAYAIRNSFAKRVLKELENKNIGIDSILGNYIIHNGIKAVVFHPALFYQDVLNLESRLRGRKEQLLNYLECNDTTGETPSRGIIANFWDTYPIISENCAIRVIISILLAFLLYIILCKKKMKYRLYIVLTFAVIIYALLGIQPFKGWINKLRFKKIITSNKKEHNLFYPIQSKAIKKIYNDKIILTMKGYSVFNPNFLVVEHVYKSSNANRSNSSFKDDETERKDFYLSQSKSKQNIPLHSRSNILETYQEVKIVARMVKEGTIHTETLYAEGIVDPIKGKLIIENQRIILRGNLDKLATAKITGFEDMRIFKDAQNTEWLIGVNLDGSELNLPYMVMIRLKECIQSITGIHRTLKLVYPPLSMLPNKNWMPLLKDDTKLVLIPNIDPLLIVEPNLINGKCSLVYQAREELYKSNMGILRNSTIPLRIEKNLFLMAVHYKYVEGDFKSDGKLIYYQHRFCIIDLRGEYKVILGKPFNVDKDGLPHIEYISGMAWIREKKLLWIGYGIEDREAKICYITEDLINEYMDYPLFSSF